MRGLVVLDAFVVLTANFSVDQEVAGVLELAVLALTATVVEIPADGGIVVFWTALLVFAVAYHDVSAGGFVGSSTSLGRQLAQ
jgi:hypothetical protein